ncbi:MAG: alpha-L-fucosidase, partial [Blastocatellia bacterium]|nr:alpha-L-fucosidase [Blastocatellia bacterium]
MLNRRQFIVSSLIAGRMLSAQAGAQSRGQHRLPANEVHLKRVRDYVEDLPVPEYHWASERAYEAFRDLKYGVRLHWGIYSTLKLRGESWPFLAMSFEERQRYQQIYRTWNPRDFDADAWMELFADCGMRMFAFTSKHHDGFSMFDTKTRVVRRANWTASGGPRLEDCNLPYSIMETPFRRDIVGELCRAARKRGLKIDLYFSHPDWYDADFRPYNYAPIQAPSSATISPPDYPDVVKRNGDRILMAPDPGKAEVERMMTRHRTQLSELLTNYGQIDMLCLDQWLGPSVWPQLRETIIHLRKLQPDVMLRARGIGNYGDYYTPEGFVPGNKENTGMPWFVIYPLGSSFSYEDDPARHKGAAWIVRNIVDCAAKGGNFMVGIGPDGEGRFHPTAKEQLREAGAWLKVNGQGIYATREREGELWREGDEVRFTRSKDSNLVHAFMLSWPGKYLKLSSVRPRSGAAIHLLGHPDQLSWRLENGSLIIDLPESLQDPARRPCQFAWGMSIP